MMRRKKKILLKLTSRNPMFLRATASLKQKNTSLEDPNTIKDQGREPQPQGRITIEGTPTHILPLKIHQPIDPNQIEVNISFLTLQPQIISKIGNRVTTQMQEPVLITIPLHIPLRIINNQDKITQINLTLISSISSSNIKVNFLRISPSTLTHNLLEVPKEDSKLLVWILIIF